MAEPVITAPPPSARLPAGQSCCWLFGLPLLDAPLPEINCNPEAPGGPAGPCGPAGIWPRAKSAARREASFTFAELTALFFSWTVPTLFRGSALETAKAVPLSEITRATDATTSAGEGGRRRTAGEFRVRVGGLSPCLSSRPNPDVGTRVRVMWAVEHSVETSAKAEDVWRLWADVERWPDWNSGIERIELRGPFAVGSTILMTPPGDEPVELRISEATEPELFVDEADGGDFVVRTTHRVEGVDDERSRITYRMEISGPAAETVGPEIGPEISSDFPEMLAALAARAEGRA